MFFMRLTEGISLRLMRLCGYAVNNGHAVSKSVSDLCVNRLLFLGRRDGHDRGEAAPVLGGRDRLGSSSDETVQAPHQDQPDQEDGRLEI